MCVHHWHFWTGVGGWGNIIDHAFTFAYQVRVTTDNSRSLLWCSSKCLTPSQLVWLYQGELLWCTSFVSFPV